MNRNPVVFVWTVVVTVGLFLTSSCFEAPTSDPSRFSSNTAKKPEEDHAEVAPVVIEKSAVSIEQKPTAPPKPTGEPPVVQTSTSLKIVAPRQDLKEGEGLEIEVAVLSEGKAVGLVGDSPVWTTSDESILRIDSVSGKSLPGHKVKLLGVSQGKAILHARVGENAASLELTVTQATLESIEIEGVPARVIVGKELTLKAIGIYSDQRTRDITEQVAFSASNTNALKSLGHNRFLPTAAASVDLTAQKDGKTALVNVMVFEPILEGLSFGTSPVVIPAGIPHSFSLLASYEGGTVVDVTKDAQWKFTSDEFLEQSATEPSVFSGRKIGEGEVIASYSGLTEQHSVEIIEEPLSLSVTLDKTHLPAGIRAGIVVTASFSLSPDLDVSTRVTVESQSPLIKVTKLSNASYSVHGISEGTGSVMVTYGKISQQLGIIIDKASLVSLSVAAPHSSVYSARTMNLKAEGLYTDDSRQDLSTQVIWRVSDVNVAKIENIAGSQGALTGKAPGVVTVSATDQGLSGISGQLEIAVIKEPLPTLVLKANNQADASTVAKNATANVTWSSANAKTCTLTFPGEASSSLLEGTKSLQITKSLTVAGSCTNYSGDVVSKNLVITMIIPSVTLSVNGLASGTYQAKYGEPLLVDVNPLGFALSACAKTFNGVASLPSKASVSGTFMVACQDAFGNQDTKSVAIVVEGPFADLKVSGKDDGFVVLSGTTITLSKSHSQLFSCSLKQNSTTISDTTLPIILNATATFTLDCRDFQSVLYRDQIVVKAVSPITQTLTLGAVTASQFALADGETRTIAFSSTGAESCELIKRAGGIETILDSRLNGTVSYKFSSAPAASLWGDVEFRCINALFTPAPLKFQVTTTLPSLTMTTSGLTGDYRITKGDRFSVAIASQNTERCDLLYDGVTTAITTSLEVVATRSSELQVICSDKAANVAKNALQIEVLDRDQWTCISGINVPVKLSSSGDAMCRSIDGKTCDDNEASTCQQKLSATYYKYLECGNVMQARSGSNGYDGSAPWCSETMNYFLQEIPTVQTGNLWSCVNSPSNLALTPLRLNENNLIECASTDSINCLSTGTSCEANRALTDLKVISCSQGDIRDWCTQGLAALRNETELKDPITYTAVAVDGSSGTRKCPAGSIVTGVNFSKESDSRTKKLYCSAQIPGGAPTVLRYLALQRGIPTTCNDNEVIVAVNNQSSGDDHVLGIHCSPRVSLDSGLDHTTIPTTTSGARDYKCPQNMFMIGVSATASGDWGLTSIICSP